MRPKLGTLWNRFQGKRQVQTICEKVFDQCAHDDLLALNELHLVTLLAYDSINKCFPKPHKSPPSREEIEHVIKDLQGEEDGKNAIDRAQFCELVLKWSQEDLNIYIRYKILDVITAAGKMVAFTKSIGELVPGLKRVVHRVPTPLLASAYAVIYAVFDDVRVD